MEVNVRNALSCLTGDDIRAKTQGSVQLMTSTIRFYKVALPGVRRAIFEVEYSVRNKDDPDMLRIPVRPLGE
jgi:hypothetical protein